MSLAGLQIIAVDEVLTAAVEALAQAIGVVGKVVVNQYMLFLSNASGTKVNDHRQLVVKRLAPG